MQKNKEIDPCSLSKRGEKQILARDVSYGFVYLVMGMRPGMVPMMGNMMQMRPNMMMMQPGPGMRIMRPGFQPY